MYTKEKSPLPLFFPFYKKSPFLFGVQLSIKQSWQERSFKIFLLSEEQVEVLN